MKKKTFALKGQKGVTLIELSVVIAVILVLISVLFVGASYYRDSANKSACVINQSAIAKAAESYMNIESLQTTTVAALSGSGAPFEVGGLPVCPEAGSYTFFEAPAGGQVIKTATNAGGDDGVQCNFDDGGTRTNAHNNIES